MPGSETQILAEASNCVFLDFGGLFVGLFWGDTNATHGELFVEAAETFLSTRQGRHGVLILVSADSRPPSRALRQDLVKAIGMLSEGTECYASVLTGKGVKASTLRAIMGALLMAMPRVSRARVYSTLEEGIAWCNKHLPLDTDQLLETIERYRPARGW